LYEARGYYDKVKQKVNLEFYILFEKHRNGDQKAVNIARSH
jgi:replicative DNA helicase